MPKGRPAQDAARSPRTPFKDARERDNAKSAGAFAAEDKKAGDDLDERELQKLLAQPLRHSVYYYYSTEEYLVRDYAAKTLALLLKQENDAEVTRIEGPAPSIEQAVAAAGTISLFGTKRIVQLPLLLPSAMAEEDVAALCDLMQSLENAVLVMSTVFQEEKAMTAKKAKRLIAAAEKAGAAVCLKKPRRWDIERIAAEKAQALGVSLNKKAASELVERCGADLFTLESELQKLAAACGYGEITPEWIGKMGTQTIETDVFEMINLVTARRETAAMEKLAHLIALQNKPVAIAAALAGSFVDMYRVKCGALARRDANAVYRDLSYTGNPYRLKKAGEAASLYTLPQLQQTIEVLMDLDLALKSSAADGEVLLQTALCEMMRIGGTR